MRPLLSLLAAVAIFAVGCSASGISSVTEGVARATGQDPERAKALGAAAGKVAGGVGTLSYEDERAIGDGIAVRSFAAQGALHPSDELQRYVNLVGRTVAAAAPRDIPYIFAVVDSEAINAWAAPGGYVFITSATLRDMEDEAELAGVLGHELVHVNRRHMVTMLQRAQLLEGATEIAASSSRALAQFSNSISAGEEILFAKGFDRNMEYEADALGVEYATAAGYDPTGLRRYLAKLAANEAQAGGWLSSTHPTISQRVERIDDKIKKDLDGFGGAVQRDRFQRMRSLLQ